MSDHSALLGTQPSEAEAVTEVETPETGTSSGEATEVATETQGEGTEGEATTEQADESAETAGSSAEAFLSKKGISPEKIEEYRARYGNLFTLIDANPSLKDVQFFLWDKINSDNTLAKPAEKKEEKATENQPPANLEEHFKAVAEKATKFSDPKVRDHLVARLEGAKTVGEQFDVLQLAVHNYMETVLPQLVPNINTQHQTEQQRAQQEAYTVHSNLWTEMRSANPNLPEDLKGAYEEAVKVLPLLEQPMDPKQRLQAIAAIVGGKKRR
jgi:hypothetical protein